MSKSNNHNNIVWDPSMKVDSISDITEATLDNFKILAESSLDAILLGVTGGKHVFANQASSKITGYSIKELTTKISINELTAPDELPKIKENFKKRLSGQQLINKYETVIIHKNGNHIPIELTATKTRWFGQIGVIVFFRDISHLKILDNQLSISEARLRAALNCIPVDFWIRDINDICIMQNEISKNIWGDLVGKTLKDIDVDPETLVKWQNNNIQALKGEIVDEEMIHTNKQGTKYYRVIIAPVIDKNEIKGLIGFNIDITDQKKARVLLQNTQAELELKVKERTIDLEQSTLLLEKQIEQRIKFEKELRQTANELKIERDALGRKTIALEELVKHFQIEIEEVKQQIATNIKQTIFPAITRLKSLSSISTAKKLTKLETDLKDICSPFLKILERQEIKLTPREIEICQLIKNGIISKEIATTRDIAEQTVSKHRKNIRKKLKIPAKVNLVTYLRSMDLDNSTI